MTQVKSVIGALSYFRKFIKNFSDKIRPILDLQTADKIEWTREHTQIVEDIMDHLEKDCFLKLPSYDRPFEIFTDYSGQGIGGVLM